jgi:hypothetical protein
MRKLILWVPVLMVGSLLYWTIALNFGGLSLLALSSFAIPADDPLVDRLERDSYQPITVQMNVNLSDRDEPTLQAPADEDPVVVDVVSDHETPRSGQGGAGDHRSDQGPGETAF